MRAEESLERELLKSSSAVQQLGATEDVERKIIGDALTAAASWKVGWVQTWKFPKVGGTPKKIKGFCSGKSCCKVDDLGVPP